jgi:hypothetical protein
MLPRRSLLIGAAAILALTVVGCAPPWHVIVQAVPDPFVAQRRFALLPIDFSGLRVGGKSETEYLDSKDPDQQRSFAGDKDGINSEFVRSLLAVSQDNGIDVVLAARPTDAPFLIRPMVQFVEPGFEAIIVKAPARIEAVVRITAADGRVLDEITVKGTSDDAVSGFGERFSSGGRLRVAGKAIGVYVGKYLRTRVEP